MGEGAGCFLFDSRNASMQWWCKQGRTQHTWGTRAHYSPTHMVRGRRTHQAVGNSYSVAGPLCVPPAHTPPRNVNLFVAACLLVAVGLSRPPPLPLARLEGSTPAHGTPAVWLPRNCCAYPHTSLLHALPQSVGIKSPTLPHVLQIRTPQRSSESTGAPSTQYALSLDPDDDSRDRCMCGCNCASRVRADSGRGCPATGNPGIRVVAGSGNSGAPPTW
jgi:hypothetical protein